MSKKLYKKNKPTIKTATPKECGECSVCCISLRIDTPELAKPANTPCKYLAPTSGCSIYERRPEICKVWRCGWLMLETLPSQFRPDRSKVLITLKPQPGVSFQITPIDEKSVISLLDDDVLMLIRNFTATKLPVAISVPTRPGYCNYIQLINNFVGDVITDKGALRERVAELIRHASNQVTDKKRHINHTDTINFSDN